MTNNTETYVVVGPNGVGKTTIARAVAESSDGACLHIAGSAVLMEALGVSTHADLERMEPHVKDTAFNAAMLSMMRAPRQDDRHQKNVIDTHLLFCRDGKMETYVLPWTCAVNGIVAVVADPEVVYDRIQEDASRGTRSRSSLPAGLGRKAATTLLDTYITTSRNFAYELGAEKGIPVFEVDNSQPCPAIAVGNVSDFLKLPSVELVVA